MKQMIDHHAKRSAQKTATLGKSKLILELRVLQNSLQVAHYAFFQPLCNLRGQLSLFLAFA